MLSLKKTKGRKKKVITDRLNLKKYFLGSLIPTIICYLFSKDQNDVIGISIVLVATILNQIMLVSIVGESISYAASKGQSKEGLEGINKKRIILFFFLKFFILFLGLYGGYYFMEKRVIIPLLNYVVLIFVLTLSIKRE